MGSGHPLQIDGIGGGNSLSSKVAIVGPATRADADVDYLFAKVKPKTAVLHEIGDTISAR
ncbi:FldA protein [Devosia sp. LC5]|nr:FldA protein [Devosia sp. LC5]